MVENGDFITLESYTFCSSSNCDVISGSSAVQFEEFVFTDFVTARFALYFDRELESESDKVNETSSDSEDGSRRRLSDETALNFTIIGIGETTELYPSTAMATEYIYYVLTGISGMFVFGGMMAFLYEKGVIPMIRPKVDISLWSACCAMGLQFWDFASDISLSFEIWGKCDLNVLEMDLLGDELYLFIIAVGSTAFIVIPYFSNLYIAGNIKKMVHNNEAASTW